jgi:threonine aldolase
VSQRFPESAYDPSQCRTNIVAFEHRAARSIVARLRTSGVRCDTIAPTRVRLVTHANLTEADVDRACDIIGSLSLQ